MASFFRVWAMALLTISFQAAGAISSVTANPDCDQSLACATKQHEHKTDATSPRVVLAAADSSGDGDRIHSTVVAGVSVVEGRVYVDGEEVPKDATRFRSPRTGDVYLIDRRDGAVVVTSESRARRDAGSPATVNVEARSTRGATVNAGKAVVITGE